MAEPNILGGGGFDGSTNPVPMSGGKFEFPGLSETANALKDVTTNLSEFRTVMKDISSNQAQLTQGVNQVMSTIQQGASQTSHALNQSLTGSLGTTTTSGIPYATNQPMAGGSGGAGTFQNTLSGAMNSGGNLTGASGIVATLGNLFQMPIRYAYDRIEENRFNAMGMAQQLGAPASLTGQTIQDIIQTLSEQIPVRGGINEMLGAVNVGAQTGYGNFQTERSGSYFTALRQMQQLNPGTGADVIAQQYSGYLGNTQAQQRSMILTGGAMSSFGPGGRPKTLQEWAEGLIKFFQNQRPGADRGKPFTKEQLEVQMFPGSNMDAWMNVNGVPDYMRSYFWQYAMSKSTITGGTGGDVTMAQITEARGTDLAFERLRTATAQSRREFTMAGAEGITWAPSNKPLYEAYAQREGADRRLNEILNQLDRVLGSLGSGVGNVVSRVPTPITNIMMDTLQALPTMLGQLTAEFTPFGDPEASGDGGYGQYGGTGIAHMDPSFGRKVEAMMEANPRLFVNSGFRDGALQGRLHEAGVGRTAPAGHSMHGRGLAADLGPESEFGWIAANAHRFGLENAAHMGEPWHVGQPGTIPIGDSFLDKIGSGIGGALKSLNPLDFLRTALSPLVSVFQLMGDMVGAGSAALRGDLSQLFGKGGLFNPVELGRKVGNSVFDLIGIPDALNPLKLLSGEADWSKDSTLEQVGAFLGGSNNKKGVLEPRLTSSVDWSKTGEAGISPEKLKQLRAINYGQGGSSGGAAGSVGGGTVMPGSVQSVLSKYGESGWSGPSDDVSEHKGKIVQALDAAKRAGFSGDELIAAVAIAGRESTWNRNVHNWNPGTGDDSYGLWQINMAGSLGASRRRQFNIPANTMLFERDVNARAAKSLYDGRGGSFHDWGPYKGRRPLYDAHQYVEPVYQIAKQAGFVGDPRRAGGGVGITAPVFSSSSHDVVSMSSAPITISNQFTIQSSGGETDARRLAAVASDKIMDELHDRLSRSR